MTDKPSMTFQPGLPPPVFPTEVTRETAIDAARTQLKQLAMTLVVADCIEGAQCLLGAVTMCGQAIEQLHQHGTADEPYNAP